MVVLAAESADAWQDVVSRCFIPISCDAFEPDFHGTMDHLPLSDTVSVSSVATHGHTVDRSARLAAHADGDDLHLSLQLASRGTVRQGRRMISVRRGAASIYATDAPYHLDYSEPGQRQLIVQVSRSTLDVPASTFEAALGQLAIAPTAATRVFFTYARELHATARLDDARVEEPAAEVTADLASAMIRTSVAGAPVLPRTPAGLMRAIEDFVAVNLSRVRVEDIAAEFFVSRRTVYHLFEQRETTPGDYLRRARLSLAAAYLHDATRASESIVEIAKAAGFDDATTFTRAFRREHGVTPREWRGRPRAPLSEPAA